MAFLRALAAASCLVDACVQACYPGQKPCGHPHPNRCCGIPTGKAPAPAHVTVAVDPKNVTHQTNPLFNGCHSDSGFTHQPRGFYAQMVLGESFEGLNLTAAEFALQTRGRGSTRQHEVPVAAHPVPSPGSPRNPWSAYHAPTADATAWIDPSRGFHGRSSLSLGYTSGSGVAGLANRGLANEGLVFEAGKEQGC
jgi:hypothetical protein